MIHDLVVIGGGINGAAVLREAGLRGLNAVLLERADFGSGSTSRSSRLLHCGLRYLAPGGSMMDFVKHPGQLVRAINTVRRSMSARNALVRERLHLLRPIRMMFPIFEGDNYAGWQMDAAFALLSRFGGGDVPLDYRRYGPDQLGEELPFAEYLPSDRRLKTVIAYTEYQIDWPERLTMDLILEARALGATAYNYTPVTGLVAQGQFWRINIADGKEFKARAVANLAGPWVDTVAALSDMPAHRMVNTTRGAHICLQLPQRFRGHGIMTLSGVDHPFYCFPWRGRHFFGPTEAPSTNNPDTIAPLAQEQEELLAEARRQLPGLDLQKNQLAGGWAGLRPLTHEPATMLAARNRVIHDLSPEDGPRMLALTNGSIGAHAVTARDVLGRLGYEDRPKAEQSGMPPRSPLVRDPAMIASTEQVVHLEDLMWRRLGLVWDDDAGLSKLDTIADAMARHLGWSTERRDAEAASYRRRVRELGIIEARREAPL